MVSHGHMPFKWTQRSSTTDVKVHAHQAAATYINCIHNRPPEQLKCWSIKSIHDQSICCQGLMAKLETGQLDSHPGMVENKPNTSSTTSQIKFTCPTPWAVLGLEPGRWIIFCDMIGSFKQELRTSQIINQIDLGNMCVILQLCGT